MTDDILYYLAYGANLHPVRPAARVARHRGRTMGGDR